MADPLIEFIVDALLVVLSIAFVYLLQTRGYLSGILTSTFVQTTTELKGDEREREEYLKKVRDRRKTEMERAKRDKLKFEHMRDEAKKKLIKGEIDQSTYRDVLMEVEKSMIEVESRIKTLEGM